MKEDVKEAVLSMKKEFEMAGGFSEYTRKKWNEIFGDFEK